MAKKAEQNDRHERHPQSTKRLTNRQRRRAEVKDPESAPKKNAYRGYSH
jgi:hypothetical protein